MSHEIYYTSAPEGLKRGASGFCTVAASDNIPRALAERLETLSAYRHHFAPNHGGGQNPVSYAHWFLNVAGATYHVLSRVCDSGFDHTQRTNAFAHHLVIDNGELAPGGPAWMLARNGVMVHSWDGRVGPIHRAMLPRGAGDTNPAICHAWAQATGDPGWGGHLADIFSKSPAKPVCILFAPGQELLPLLAESIALLPPLARWNVTFNTYFTSMPTSATCLWRCCLVDTPAAQIGLRYAGGGIVINLADTSRLGQVPAGAYVTLARTGQPPAGVARAVSAPAQPAARRSPAVAARPAMPASAPAPNKPEEPAPIPEEAWLAAEAVDAATPAASAGPGATASPARPLAGPARGGTLSNVRRAEEALRNAEQYAAQASARQRRQVLALFLGAIAVLGAGTLLLWYITRNSAPPEIKSVVETQPRVTTPQLPIATAPAPVTPHPPETSVSPITTAPAPREVVVTPVPVPAPPPLPGLITLSAPLDRAAPGAGIADRTQSLTFRAADLEPGIARVSFVFPNGKSTYTFKNPQGTLSSTTERVGGGAGARYLTSITWARGGEGKDSSPDAVAQITFDRRRSALEVEWKSATMVKRPDVARLAYWVLQSSTLDLVSRRAGTQHLAFKPVTLPAIDLTEAATPLKFPEEIPPDATVTPVGALPPGWQVTWYTDWEDAAAKDAALRTPETASQVLKFHKPGTTAAVESWFIVTFRPGFTKMESTFSRRRAADEAELARDQSDLRAITADIQRMCAESGLKETDERLKPYMTKKSDISTLVDAYKAAAAGYKDLTEFDVALDLPDGLRLVTLHCKAPGK